MKPASLPANKTRRWRTVLPVLILLVALFGMMPAPVSADSATITPTVPATAAPVSSGATITTGMTVSGNLLDATIPDRFSLIGTYGDLLTVGLFPTHGQARAPGLTLYAPDGSIAATTSGDQDRATLLSGVTLPSSGAYILYIQAADSTALGPYTLSVGSGWILRDFDGGLLRLDSPTNGVLARAGDRQRWTVRLAAGTQFTVSAQPTISVLDPVLEVLTPSGGRLAVAHDFSPAHSPTTVALAADSAGLYTILVSAYVNGSAGAYRLTISAQPPTPTPFLTAEPINQSLYARVNTGGQYNYAFQGVPGQAVSIEVHSQPVGTFDPLLELYGPSGRRVAINDDLSAGNADAALEGVILNDGVGLYSVHVTGYALAAGTFVLVIHSP